MTCLKNTRTKLKVVLQWKKYEKLSLPNVRNTLIVL